MRRMPEAAVGRYQGMDRPYHLDRSMTMIMRAALKKKLELPVWPPHMPGMALCPSATGSRVLQGFVADLQLEHARCNIVAVHLCAASLS